MGDGLDRRENSKDSEADGTAPRCSSETGGGAVNSEVESAFHETGAESMRAVGSSCDPVRELLSLKLDFEGELSDGEELSVSKHLDDCRHCREWHTQTVGIVDVARSMPQFDVSERLTQSILSSVALEENARYKELSTLVYALAVAAFLLLLFVDSSESIWGIGSWILGLVTMVGLKALVTDSSKKPHAV